MAEDIRISGPRNGDLTAAHAALVKECLEQARNTLYTSTSFFIWLRTLKFLRAVLWVLAAASGAAAASTVLSSREDMELVIAGLALLAVILPGATKALNLDDAIKAYAEHAGAFKNAEGELRRAANVWSNKTFDDFEKDAKFALSQLDEARRSSLTPPEWCFKSAQRKVKSGDYDPDIVGCR